jgi:hypothetical protein
MCRRPDRIVLIEPDAARRELLLAILANRTAVAEIGVFSSEAEARSVPGDCRSAVLFAALSPLGHPGKSHYRSLPVSDAGAALPAQDDGLVAPLAQFAHAVRGSLSVILNSVFVLKRKGDDERILHEFLDLIEHQVKALEPALADYVEHARANGAET